MPANNGQNNSSRVMWVTPLVVLAIVVGLAVVWRIVHAPAPLSVTVQPKLEPNAAPLPAAEKPQAIVSKELASQPIITAQFTIDDVIKVRKYWDPGFPDWVGKQAPNFDLADIDGKNHKLSNYKGINVMLVFWATWCGPCRMEIPDLIELRKQTPQEKLAIVAISYEQGDRVRQFVSQNPVNYTVIAAPQQVMPVPFAMINAIPSTFFIDKDGLIRLAAVGLVLPKEVQMILKALD